jgi:hypothetical protein
MPRKVRTITKTLTIESYEAEGIFIGDKILIIPVKEKPLVNGARVIAITPDGEVGMFGYHPPYLTTQSRSIDAPIKIVLMDIIGTAIKVQRDLS